MKKAIKKIVAVMLVIVMLSGIGSVIGFAEETAETTTAASDDVDVKDVVDGGLNFFQQISKFIYDFLNFLHEQYMKFIGNADGNDPFDWLFNGDLHGDDLIWGDFVV